MSSAGERRVAASLERMREGGIKPKRDLGQNFLIDANMLEVVAKEADVGPGDTVLEVGGGLGILSEHLAAKAAHLHVVEIDPGLEGALTEAIEPFDNVTLHFADAMHMDLGSLDPEPTKLVANLPYGIAAPLILDSIPALPKCQIWVGMVQKEVGDRLAASPGSKTYGAPSALAQLACKVKVVRPVSRTVFRPIPNVDSVIVRLDRVRPATGPAVRALIREGFAHRRKALARSLSLAPGAAEGIRDRTRAALEEMGLPADARAETLGPQQFVELAERMGLDA
ncbi:MAG: 16S rRNA (adenine(1518)-N(6)/adenine(1519)-N(6))-dimethyltransferase RsmA [Solirubrobacterales bacterium]|nr:16S rRNA (adenine(1518)-N(6)/adenine(1519)-N(6))-dimethyltransferase RsmA [Solirubrobacterales bacterium]